MKQAAYSNNLPSLSTILTPPLWQSRYLRLRDDLLFRLLRVDREVVLNKMGEGIRSETAVSLPNSLLETLRQLQSKTISHDGRRVNYDLMRSEPAYRALRQDILPALQQLDPTSFSDQTAARAFWINLYNALIIDAIVQFEIQESVTEGWIGILAFFRRAAYEVGGHRLSLEDIENGILRGNRGHPYFPGAQFAAGDPRLAWTLPLEPRIHFGLNCASRSCPPLNFYDAAELAAQLDAAAVDFLADSTAVLPQENKVVLSQIFNWYKKDFNGREGLIQLLLRYLPESEKRRFLREKAASVQIEFAAYDWKLNS